LQHGGLVDSCRQRSSTAGTGADGHHPRTAFEKLDLWYISGPEWPQGVQAGERNGIIIAALLDLHQ
jgi:hypothetical protein